MNKCPGAIENSSHSALLSPMSNKSKVASWSKEQNQTCTVQCALLYAGFSLRIDQMLEESHFPLVHAICFGKMGQEDKEAFQKVHAKLNNVDS